MAEESPPTNSRPGRVRRVVVSVGVGAAIAAAMAAFIAPIAMWAVRSPHDFMSKPLTRMGVAAIVTGVCVLVLVASRLVRRYPSVQRMGVAAGCVAVGLGGWSAWNVFGLYKSRDALAFVDSTGATVIAAAAMLAAVAAATLGVATAAFTRYLSSRTALCACLVVAVAIPALTYRSVRHYRAGVWRPQLTAAATTPAAIPDAIGPVRYRIPLDPNDHTADIYAAGNGFIIDTRKGLTAYDGSTGAKRWHIGDYGTSGRLLVVRRDRDDASGIVVVFLYYGLIAFDGSSGEVLWRRQYGGGEVTAATGSVDALGMAVFTADSTSDGPDRTRLHSLDPATGELRWSRPISCSNPTLSPGTPGQFGFSCAKPSIVDAHTGNTIDVPGNYTPRAGPDAYVIEQQPPEDGAPADATRVMDPAGKIIDEVPGAYPVSVPHNGFLLVYGGGSTWVLRDYHHHRSTPVLIRTNPGRLQDLETVWLRNSLLITNPYDHPRRFELVDPNRPGGSPRIIESPCAHDKYLADIQSVAGAVVAQCSSSDMVGMVPEHR
ncbi:outer membrane protein assembly factor BamB family protein [Mycobacterium branderi]|uniref:Pyrrolo-quinoline quinone repeat domain-containing protein n=1 Tax=Mycobacterium branderi TaxID=43348 RepID=A0A7I7WEC3_9MYCO|nr:PQQ-binding-like beta-propeller repeat protein [Mycobacterium branderi]MCV7236385.1 PQQ-binding-like beta-propeller repeat protein [Mycobacterium branderi]ORA32562.1 hypothetical protein BST20_24465 [Mycobacterium branderi]BBZ15272.1 hypothetical protein MBRA_54670 [Mycobacterium branderi]